MTKTMKTTQVEMKTMKTMKRKMVTKKIKETRTSNSTPIQTGPMLTVVDLRFQGTCIIRLC